MKRETSPDRQVKGGRRGLGACEVRRKAVGGGGGQGARGWWWWAGVWAFTCDAGGLGQEKGRPRAPRFRLLWLASRVNQDGRQCLHLERGPEPD